MGKCLTSALEVAFPVVRSPLRFSFGTGFPTVEIDEERRIFLAIPGHLRQADNGFIEIKQKLHQIAGRSQKPGSSGLVLNGSG